MHAACLQIVHLQVGPFLPANCLYLGDWWPTGPRDHSACAHYAGCVAAVAAVVAAAVAATVISVAAVAADGKGNVYYFNLTGRYGRYINNSGRYSGSYGSYNPATMERHLLPRKNTPEEPQQSSQQ